MLNKVISMASGFIFGFSVISAILQNNWTMIIPAICAVIIMISNFTGFGE